MKRSNDRKAMCYHEAGHAVVHLWFYQGVSRIKATATNGFCESVSISDLNWLLEYESYWSWRRAGIEAMLAILAGPSAEWMYLDWDREEKVEVYGQDYDSIESIMQHFNLGPRGGFVGTDRWGRYIRRRQNEANRLVRMLRVPIREVAEALYRSRSRILRGGRIEAIVDPHFINLRRK